MWLSRRSCILPQEVIDELMKNGYVYEDKKEDQSPFILSAL